MPFGLRKGDRKKRILEKGGHLTGKEIRKREREEVKRKVGNPGLGR